MPPMPSVDTGPAIRGGYVASAERRIPHISTIALARGIISSPRAVEIKTYALIFLMMLFGTVGNAILDEGMKHVGVVELSSRPAIWNGLVRVFASGTIWLGVVCLLLYMLSQMLVLSLADYSFVMPFTAISYVLVALAGRLFLGEPVTPTRWLGIAFIICGVFLVSRTPPNTTAGDHERAGRSSD
jgi:drug/metabolite transporter (DMT)-like permease